MRTRPKGKPRGKPFERGNRHAEGRARRPHEGTIRRGRFLTQQLIARLNDRVRDPKDLDADEREAMAIMVDALVDNAMMGDQAAIAFCFDRVEGKVPQEVNANMTVLIREKLKYLSDDELELYERVCTMFRNIRLIEQDDGSYAPVEES